MPENTTGISDLPGSIIGFRKNGRPIRLQAGGAEGDAPEPKTYTEDELNRLLTRERDKLHSRLDKSADTTEAIKAELAELQKERNERVKAEEKARKDAEAAVKKAAEAELSAKQLIDQRTTELRQQYDEQQDQWAAQVQGLQNQMAEREAIFQREREYQELANYTTAQVNAHADDIAPELTRFINGNTKEEIDAQIAQAIEATQSILSGIQSAQTAARAAMPGVSTGGFAPTGPLEAAQGGTRTLTPEEISAMPMDQFAAMRGQFGVTGGNVGTGRFGNLGKGLFG